MFLIIFFFYARYSISLQTPSDLWDLFQKIRIRCLTDRKQKVVIDGFASNVETINAGVPQGCIYM
jgi:hypothetical protein